MAGTRGPARSCVGFSAFSNGCCRTASLCSGETGLPLFSGLLLSAVPLGWDWQGTVTESESKGDGRCQPVLSSAAEPFKPLEVAASAGFICVTIDWQLTVLHSDLK